MAFDQLSFPFIVEIMEGLLHRLAKSLLEPSRIETEKFLVERVNCPLSIRHVQNSSLIAVRDTYKTGPLVHDQADDACCEEERNYDDDDQMEGVRKQAASGSQGADDRPTSNDPCRNWDRNEKEVDDLTGEISHFRVRAIEQTIQ